VTTRAAYADAGVDVEAADRAVELLRARLPAIGGFGAAFELPAGYARPVLVSSTDGVGTKTDIARRLGRYDTIGRDLVAMCVDDIVCHGARPLFFLDYLAVGKVEPERVATIVGGIADACAEADCQLVGGETAEHPGLMADDEFDLAGFGVGIVERDALIDGSASRPGDAIVGMAASGLHANGFSLVRRLIDDGRLPLT
jgi:phosphoribosylformylglycinamidine cyclo-ligase